MHHPETQTWKQSAGSLQQLQAQRQTKAVVLRQIMTNEHYGQLCAEVERLLGYCGADVGKKYHLYIQAAQPTLVGVMTNIECFVGSIYRMHLIAEIENTAPPVKPQIQEDVDCWQEALKSIPDNEENIVPKQVLAETLKILGESKPARLSQETSERISTTDERLLVARDMVQHRQSEVLEGVVQTQMLQEIVTKKLEALLHDPKALEFSLKPKLNISTEDLALNNQASHKHQHNEVPQEHRQCKCHGNVDNCNRHPSH